MDMQRLAEATRRLYSNVSKAIRATGASPDHSRPLPVQDASVWSDVEATPDEVISYLQWEVRDLRRTQAALAQTAAVGMAVQMNLHETSGLLTRIAYGAKDARSAVAEGRNPLPAVERTVAAADGIAAQMEFLGRMRIGDVRNQATGRKVLAQLRHVFGQVMDRGALRLEVTDAFLDAVIPIREEMAHAVVLNLMRNAYYWSSKDRPKEAGSPRIRLDAERIEIPAVDPDSDDEWLAQPSFVTKFSVEDDGPGILADDRDRALAPYSSGRGSTGIGLHLCRMVLEKEFMGIALEDPGELGGARIVFGGRKAVSPIPASPADRREMLTAAAWSLAGLHADGEGERLADAMDVYGELSMEALRIRISGPADAVDVALATAIETMEGLASGGLDPSDVDWPHDVTLRPSA